MKEVLFRSKTKRLTFDSLRAASLVEVMLAVALFSIVVVAVGGALIYGNQSAATAGARARASMLAEEAKEVLRNQRDASFANIAAGTYKLVKTGADWQLVATTPSSPETIDSFTRLITITSVDANTASAVITVNWQQTLQRAGNVTLTTRFTNWRRVGSTPCTGGILAYADISVTGATIKYKPLDSATCTWGTEQTVPSFSVPGNAQTRVVKLYSSPARNEKILVTKHVGASNTYIYAQVWNGSAWGNVVQLDSRNNTTFPDVRDFSADFLNNGTFLIAYDANGNTFRYRTWNGTVWSAQANGQNLGGKPGYMVLRNRPGTNDVMLAVLTENNRTVTSLYTGGAWAAVTVHSTNSASTAYEAIDWSWSPNTTTTGALIYTDAANDTNPNIKIWNGTTWTATVQNLSIGANTRSMTITGRPSNNEFLACFKDSANKVTCLKTVFTPLWQTVTNGTLTSTTDSGAQRSFEASYERAAQLALSVYSGGADNAVPKYRTYNPSTSTFSVEATLATLTTALKSVTIVQDPNTNDLMVVMGTNGLNIWTAGWDGTNNVFYSSGSRALTNQATHGTNATDYWFDFAWNRF